VLGKKIKNYTQSIVIHSIKLDNFTQNYTKNNWFNGVNYPNRARSILKTNSSAQFFLAFEFALHATIVTKKLRSQIDAWIENAKPKTQ